LQRWRVGDAIAEDKRPTATRPEPFNKLSDEEQQQILDICNKPEFADLPPNQIVPTLADRGIYIACEATFYRVLKAHKQLINRTRSKSMRKYHKPKAQMANDANQVWTWDISHLPGITKGKHFYLYMILDIFSRKIVGVEVHDQELGEYAAALLQRAVWSEKCVNKLRSFQRP
jgi:transposase InsO family protein